MSLYDFYMYLKYIEYSAENLEFYIWYVAAPFSSHLPVLVCICESRLTVLRQVQELRGGLRPGPGQRQGVRVHHQRVPVDVVHRPDQQARRQHDHAGEAQLAGEHRRG